MMSPSDGADIPDGAIYSPGYGNRPRYVDSAGNILVQQCSKCKRLLSADAFSKHAAHPRGINTQCKVCEAQRAKRYYAADPITKLVKSIVIRSEKNGVFCDLTPADVWAINEKQGGRCFYSGKEFGDINSEDTLSVDKIDPERGYTRDNIVLCCMWVNVMKRDYNVEDFLARIALLAQNLDTLASSPELSKYIRNPRPPKPVVSPELWRKNRIAKGERLRRDQDPR